MHASSHVCCSATCPTRQIRPCISAWTECKPITPAQYRRIYIRTYVQITTTQGLQWSCTNMVVTDYLISNTSMPILIWYSNIYKSSLTAAHSVKCLLLRSMYLSSNSLLTCPNPSHSVTENWWERTAIISLIHQWTHCVCTSQMSKCAHNLHYLEKKAGAEVL